MSQEKTMQELEKQLAVSEALRKAAEQTANPQPAGITINQESEQEKFQKTVEQRRKRSEGVVTAATLLKKVIVSCADPSQAQTTTLTIDQLGNEWVDIPSVGIKLDTEVLLTSMQIAWLRRKTFVVSQKNPKVGPHQPEFIPKNIPLYTLSVMPFDPEAPASDDSTA